jgi:hypothetical protein
VFAGPGARLFRVEDDGPTGIPNNGAFYFALRTKSVLDGPLNTSIFLCSPAKMGEPLSFGWLEMADGL